MTIRTPHRRRAAARLSGSIAVMSAFMLMASVWSIVSGGSVPVGAAPVGGVATIVGGGGGPLTSGVTNTEFFVQLPGSAQCSGDTATEFYRVLSYIVPVSVDPAGLTWAANGRPQPTGTGVNLRDALWTSTGTRFTNGATDNAPVPGGPGTISGLPGFSWTGWSPSTSAIIPPGDYNVGIACTVGDPGPTQLDKFWNVVLTFTVDPANAGGVAWAVAVDPGTTTTTADPGTTTTTGDPGDTTTTAAPGDTTTTTAVDGSTSSTTIAAGGSTTTISGGSGGTTFSGGNPASPSVASTVGQLPYTGNSPWSLVIWGALLLVFGRMTILLGRKPRVKTPTG